MITVIVTIVLATLALRTMFKVFTEEATLMSATADTRPQAQPRQPAPERSGSSQFTQRKIVGYLVTAAHLGAGVPVLLPGAVDDHHQLQDRRAGGVVPPPFFFEPTLDSYAAVFDAAWACYLLNSLFVSVLLHRRRDALAIPAAYALSVRPIGKWQDALFFFISTKFMPVAASIIPVFLLLRTLGLLDNLWALGLLYIGINLPLAVWMMRSFFAEVPIGRGRGGADRRRQLQPRAVAGVAADRRPRRRGSRADLLHLRLERVLPGQPAHRRRRRGPRRRSSAASSTVADSSSPSCRRPPPSPCSR